MGDTEIKNDRIHYPAKAMIQAVVLSQLYNQDFQQWCKKTVTQLKAQDFGELDREHLIEEIEGLASRDRRELESRLRVLLNHLLKRLYVPSPYDYRRWENTIDEQRSELELLLKQSPSLQQYFSEVFDDAWQYALNHVKKDYLQTSFPNEWQFSREIEIILAEQFWQEDSTANE